MSGVYVTPKTSKGAIDTSYAIVWCDQTLTQLKVTCSAMSLACGLVRITRSNAQRTSRGIRVKAGDFEAAFKQVRPGEVVPKHVKVLHMAKLTPTPVGVSMDAIKQWLEQVNLPARPIKQLGQQTWLIGFSRKVEDRWWAWNGQVMMLNFLPEKDLVVAKPVVASAAPRVDNKTTQASYGDASPTDPWAEFRLKNGLPMPSNTKVGNAASSGAPNPQTNRVTEGPIEQRFQQQDAQIDALKKAVA